MSDFDVINAGEVAAPEELVPEELRPSLNGLEQTTIPATARNPRLTTRIEAALPRLCTQHRLILADSTAATDLESESVELVLTSPPYWTLKVYEEGPGQLGHVEDYDEFLTRLDEVWRHAYRALVPGGRIVIVVGDVCLPRRKVGRHVVVPLHASIQERCRRLGFDNLAPIIWHKIANATLEASGPGGFLGKPYEPNAVIKNDIEYILFQRKPGGYRRPTPAARILSLIPEAAHREWFQQIWSIPGASTRNHPAPFPLNLATRLVRMFSFVGDTVWDPFCGTGTTCIAAMLSGRNSIGHEVEHSYFEHARMRMRQAAERQTALAVG